MIIEKAVDFVSKKDEKLRQKAGLLSIRAREAAGVVQQFGKAVVEGQALISAGDVNMMVHKLEYYAKWLQRIADGEDVAEDDLVKMEEIISTVRIPKRNKYKRGIIEVIYVQETPDGHATRHKLYEQKVDDSTMIQGNNMRLNFTIGSGKHGKRLPKVK